MACHTWCYKKVNRTIEEARELWIKEQDRFINDLINDIIDDENGEYAKELNFNPSELLNIYERQRRMVEKGLCNVAVMNNQPEYSEYIEGKGFYVDVSDEFHDPFRISEFLEDIRLYSYDECIDFITKYEKEYNENVKFGTENYKKLKDFWLKYPDGMILLC